MTGNGYLTITEARDRLRDATRIVLDAEADYEKAVRNAADGEAAYRLKVGEAFKRLRDDGAAVEAANTLARAESVMFSRERDVAAGLLRLAGEKLEDARDSRRSLWRLVTWSMEHEVAATRRTPTDERAPGDRWP
jgi:hypothetical protein